MKQVIKSTVIAGLLITGGFLGYSQDRTELCRGSGYHCMDVDYGVIKAKLVKGKNEPAAVIIEDSKSSGNS